MAEGLLTIGASASGGLLAKGFNSLMGGGGGGGTTVDDYINSMNNRMVKYLNMALNYSQGNTNRAVNVQKDYLGQGTNALNTSLANTTNLVNNNLLSAFNQSQALQSPYAMLGYNAADAYADSLGLSRPQMGSAAMAQSAASAGTINPQLIQQLRAAAQAAGQDPFTQAVSPTAPVDNRLSSAQLLQGMSPQLAAAYQTKDVNKQIQNIQNQMQNIMRSNRPNTNTLLAPLNQQLQSLQQTKNLQQQATSLLNQKSAAQNVAYDQAQQQYKQQQGLFNNYNQAQQALLNSVQGISPQQLQTALAYRNGLFNTPTGN